MRDKVLVLVTLHDVSPAGDVARLGLYEAAQSMLVRSAKWSWLKAWAMKIARHRGMNKAIVALARQLAVIMPRRAAGQVCGRGGMGGLPAGSTSGC
jgi:hypothetical protein